MGRIPLIAAGGVALFLLVGALTLWLNRDRGYDRGFDVAVAEPAYPERGPVVLFDEGHNNVHRVRATYRPFAQMLRNDGYEVRVSDEEITAETLTQAAVLVIAGARGANEGGDAQAFTDAEASAVSEWVLRGGSLLLATDHWPVGAAMAPLGERFGVEMSRGVVSDLAHAEPALSESHIVFTRESGLLLDHPISNGRTPSERVGRVLSFSGQSLRGPADATPLLRLADTARDAPPSEPRVERHGENARVSVTYGEPLPVAGWAQAVAVRFGRGRIVVLGDAGMLCADLDEGGGAIGMNRAGYDNRQFALNIMHWLSHLV
jgi:hypothetical protein